jgi:predicted nucleic acid-binding protein
VKGFLLDTNIISEIMKGRPNKRVISFLSKLEGAWVSTVTLHELDYGLALLPHGSRRAGLEKALSALIAEYGDVILPVDRAEAREAADLRAAARQAGHSLHLGDALIAGTAKAHDLCVATRNVSDFDGLGLDLVNPWAAP